MPPASADTAHRRVRSAAARKPALLPRCPPMTRRLRVAVRTRHASGGPLWPRPRGRAPDGDASAGRSPVPKYRPAVPHRLQPAPASLSSMLTREGSPRTAIPPKFLNAHKNPSQSARITRPEVQRRRLAPPSLRRSIASLPHRTLHSAFSTLHFPSPGTLRHPAAIPGRLWQSHRLFVLPCPPW